MKKIKLCLLMFCVLLNLSACSGAKEKAPSENQEKGGTVPKAASDAKADKSADKKDTPAQKDTAKNWDKIGKTVTIDDAEYAVNAVKKSKNGVLPPKDGNSYYIIDLTIKNNGKEEMAVSSIMLFDLVDAKGTKYDISLGGLASLEDDKLAQMDGSIEAGKDMRGGLAYEIPDGTKGLKLVIKSLLGDKTETVEIK